MEDGPNGLLANECRGDFWNKLQEGMELAGGGVNVEKLASMSLKDVVDLLAQNGIRMTYHEDWHIDAVGKIREQSTT